MISLAQALSSIPNGLRTPLLDEYSRIIQNYYEHRWGPSELSGGRFCEIVFTVLEGYFSGSYSSSPRKPRNFVAACRALEQNSGGVRSFRILIPRMLPALYEIRNNRGVGHVGGDVSPNHMDANAIVSMANWIMAELVRVYHNLTPDEAENLVNALAERKTPLIWESGDLKRVMDPSLSLKDHILVLLSSVSGSVSFKDLQRWTDYDNRSYLKRLLQQMHEQRLLEYNRANEEVYILPPGTDLASKISANSIN